MHHPHVGRALGASTFVPLGFIRYPSGWFLSGVSRNLPLIFRSPPPFPTVTLNEEEENGPWRSPAASVCPSTRGLARLFSRHTHTGLAAITSRRTLEGAAAGFCGFVAVAGR